MVDHDVHRGRSALRLPIHCRPKPRGNRSASAPAAYASCDSCGPDFRRARKIACVSASIVAFRPPPISGASRKCPSTIPSLAVHIRQPAASVLPCRTSRALPRQCEHARTLQRHQPLSRSLRACTPLRGCGSRRRRPDRPRAPTAFLPAPRPRLAAVQPFRRRDRNDAPARRRTPHMPSRGVRRVTSPACMRRRLIDPLLRPARAARRSTANHTQFGTTRTACSPVSVPARTRRRRSRASRVVVSVSNINVTVPTR